MDKRITFKERFYNSFAEEISEHLWCDNQPYLTKKIEGEFEPFVDDDKWCEFRIECNADEEKEVDGYDVTSYLHIDFTKLEIVQCVYKDDNIIRRPLNINAEEINKYVNDYLYVHGEDVSVEYWEAQEDAGYKEWDD